MKSRTTMFRSAAALLAAVAMSTLMAGSVRADTVADDSDPPNTVWITEWMYSPSAGPAEYVELTNVGATAVNTTGWSEDDNDRDPGVHPFGSQITSIAPGESVILCETTNAAAFRSYWGLASTVQVYAYGSQDNLGRSDEINVYDSHNALIDRLTYNDQGGLGPRTQGTSANIPLAYLGLNSPSHAVLSVVGDSYHSHHSSYSWTDGGSGDIGNPGVYTPYTAPVPEPSTLTLLAAGLLGMVCYAWRKQK